MATSPIIDLSTLDLEQVISDSAELRSKLAQRGTFDMVDAVVHRDTEAGIIVGYKDIRGDDWWAADHIPGRPLFPGVLMIEACAQLCSYDYQVNHPLDPDTFVGFGGVDKTRFRGTVEPDGRLYLCGQVHRVRSGFFTYRAQGIYREKLVMECEVIGVAL